jgi:hypothetical protein
VRFATRIARSFAPPFVAGEQAHRPAPSRIEDDNGWVLVLAFDERSDRPRRNRNLDQLIGTDLAELFVGQGEVFAEEHAPAFPELRDQPCNPGQCSLLPAEVHKDDGRGKTPPARS